MKKEKPLVFALILVTLQFIIWVAFGYGVFVYTQSLWLVLPAMLLLFCVRFCTHIFWFVKGRQLLKLALLNVPYNRFDEVSIPDKVIWLRGTMSFYKKLFTGHTAVTQDYLYIFTMVFLPREIIQVAWDDIAQIRVVSPVRATIYFNIPTEVELAVPWQPSYESYIPKTVGFQKDTSYQYKN